MAVNYTSIEKMSAYLEALDAANSAISSAQNPPPDPPPLDVTAYKTIFRNQVLAGSADKAAFLGTLSTAPTVTAADLQALGLTAAAANAVIGERDRIRTAALALLS